MEKIQRFGIRNPVEGKEGKESPEMFRASLGFDFIFTTDEKGVLHCVCIEINGHDSGVVGVQEIPKGQIDTMHKTVAGIRATEHPEMARKFKIANEVLTDIHSKEFTPSPEGLKKIHGYMKKSLKTQPTFSFAYQNPDFIEDMTRDKRIQERYIPEEYRPRTWHPGDNPSSPTGAWVVKYYDSRGGDDVHVVPNEHFPDTLSDLGPRVEKYV
ncbi:hypothetical protein FJY93_04620, partial [Candidatus Kaiserbacteria bacterium]|nr:hypothetical protein [Candidatus Kaiserbacteria bacterium]